MDNTWWVSTVWWIQMRNFSWKSVCPRCTDLQPRWAMGKCERVLCVKLDTNVMLWCVLGHTHVQPRLISVPDPILEFQVGVKKHERNLGRNTSIGSGAFRRAGGRSRHVGSLIAYKCVLIYYQYYLIQYLCCTLGHNAFLRCAPLNVFLISFYYL